MDTASINARCPQFTDALWSRPSGAAAAALAAHNIAPREALALFGLSPDLTPLSLFYVKAGRLGPPDEWNEPQIWIDRLRPAIAAGICADNGWEIIGRHDLCVQSLHYVGMGASPDFIVRCPERGIGFLNIADAAGWRAAAPPQVEIEILHILEAANLTWGVIGGLIGGNETKVFIRERDREVGAEIGNRVTDLWRRVRDKGPPGADYLKDAAAIARAFAGKTGIKSALLATLLRTPVGNQSTWVPRKRAA